VRASRVRFAAARAPFLVACRLPALSLGMDGEDPLPTPGRPGAESCGPARSRAARGYRFGRRPPGRAREQTRPRRRAPKPSAVRLAPSPERERTPGRETRPGSPGEGDLDILLDTGHPDQVQSPGLLPVGCRQQLDPSVEMLVEHLFALFVFVASNCDAGLHYKGRPGKTAANRRLVCWPLPISWNQFDPQNVEGVN
jgi:hypothetical protein